MSDSRKKATLVLQNGRRMEGWSFGYGGATSGEVVFSTAWLVIRRASRILLIQARFCV